MPLTANLPPDVFDAFCARAAKFDIPLSRYVCLLVVRELRRGEQRPEIPLSQG